MPSDTQGEATSAPTEQATPHPELTKDVKRAPSKIKQCKEKVIIEPSGHWFLKTWLSSMSFYNYSAFSSRVNCYFCNSLFSFEGQLCTFARLLSLLGRYFIILARKLLCLLFYVDMHILIGKALKHFYIFLSSLILGKHGHMDIEKHNLKRFTIHPLYKYLPTRELTVTNLKNLK